MAWAGGQALQLWLRGEKAHVWMTLGAATGGLGGGAAQPHAMTCALRSPGAAAGRRGACRREAGGRGVRPRWPARSDARQLVVPLQRLEVEQQHVLAVGRALVNDLQRLGAQAEGRLEQVNRIVVPRLDIQVRALLLDVTANLGAGSEAIRGRNSAQKRRRRRRQGIAGGRGRRPGGGGGAGGRRRRRGAAAAQAGGAGGPRARVRAACAPGRGPGPGSAPPPGPAHQEVLGARGLHVGQELPRRVHGHVLQRVAAPDQLVARGQRLVGCGGRAGRRRVSRGGR
jgi:hypothetical protein